MTHQFELLHHGASWLQLVVAPSHGVLVVEKGFELFRDACTRNRQEVDNGYAANHWTVLSHLLDLCGVPTV